MKHEGHSEDLLVRYLLGQLAESAQEHVEQTYLADQEWQGRLAIAEDDLIDDYVGGALGAADRAAFEKHFLNSPRRHERVAFARAWQQLTGAPPPSPAALPSPASRPWRERPAAWLLLAATVLLLLGSAWLIFETTRLRSELAASRAERAALAQSEEELRQQLDDERARRQAVSEQLAEARPEPPNNNTAPPSVVASFMLIAGLTRDAGERQTLNVPHTAQQVRLKLLFRQSDPPINAATYRAVLRTPEGREVFSRDGLKAQPRGGARVVTVTAPRLASGDYILTLKSRNEANQYEDITEYAFTVSVK
ncbi:MAG: hypothetical protein ACJ74G_02795 [Blastocatellia bacterium]